MSLIKAPTTIEDHMRILISLKELQSNPWADANMLRDVAERIRRTQIEINKLKK